jgi:predicted TIM-barrel fold metal-dependent hydrolase
LQAIDFHVHLPTPEWLDVSMKGYVEAAESYFRSKVARKTLEELASEYASMDMLAVLLAWDAETATGRPRVPNDVVAEACREFPQSFIGFGSVDPLKGERAIAEVDRIAELGLKGVKLHPSLQAFAPNEEQHWPLYEKCQDLGMILLFHTGTSGIGAGQLGGQGIRLDYARPIWLDAPAAAFPDLKFIAAHFGYPWHLELLAMALHKTGDMEAALAIEAMLWVDGPRTRSSPRLAVVRNQVASMSRAIAPEARWVSKIVPQPPAIQQLNAVCVPTLSIVGDADQSWIIDGAKLLAEGIPGCEFVIVPDCAHMLPMEQPELFTRLIMEFLAARNL